jgi:hypothetical protein
MRYHTVGEWGEGGLLTDLLDHGKVDDDMREDYCSTGGGGASVREGCYCSLAL